MSKQEDVKLVREVSKVTPDLLKDEKWKDADEEYQKNAESMISLDDKDFGKY